MLSRMQYEIVQNNALAIRVLLAELQSEDELFGSANTLQRVEAHVLAIAQTLAHLSPALKERLLRIDWRGWDALQKCLESNQHPRREELWYGIRALVPSTLDLIAQLRRQEPVWFEIGY